MARTSSSLPIASSHRRARYRAANRLRGSAAAHRIAALENAVAELHGVIDYAVDGIMLIAEEGTIRSFNPAAERIFGYTADEIIGQPIQTIIPPPYHVYYRLISSGTEVVGQRRDGVRFAMDLTSGRIQRGDRALFVGVARDITRRKQIAEDLAQARDDAEAASRAKTAFLMTVGHELRTPLNHIIGYGELVAEDAALRDDAQTTEDAQRIVEAGRQLLTLIDDILSLAKLESDEFALKPHVFDVHELVREVVDSIQPTLTANANLLLVEIGDSVTSMRADRESVLRVLLHLVGNACKFTCGGQICLRVALSGEGERAGGQIAFAVSDTGIGMSTVQLDSLFQPFTQADDSPSRRFGGAGVGLAITRGLCELMQGSIVVESQIGAGSQFVATLPLVANG